MQHSSKLDTQKLYLMHNSFGLHKIGISMDPERRRNEIRLSSGAEVELVKVWECRNARASESNLHGIFSSYRRNGEWFKFDTCPIGLIDEYLSRPTTSIPAITPSFAGVPEAAPEQHTCALHWLHDHIDGWVNNPKFPGYYDNLLKSKQRTSWLCKYRFLDRQNINKYLYYVIDQNRDAFKQFYDTGMDVKTLVTKRLLAKEMSEAYAYYSAMMFTV